MRRQRGIAMLEAAITLTVVVPVVILCVLVFELGRVNSELRHVVTTAINELRTTGFDGQKQNDSSVKLLNSLADKLKKHMHLYQTEVVVGTLSYVFESSGSLKSKDFVTADCAVFYPALCQPNQALRNLLDTKMTKYLNEHLQGLAVRDIDPYSGALTVVTMPGELIGVYVRLRPKIALWRAMGFAEVGEYVDVISTRREIVY